MINENEFAKEVVAAMEPKPSLSQPIKSPTMPQAQQLNYQTHAQRISASLKELRDLVTELNMTIRILEEAEKRL